MMVVIDPKFDCITAGIDYGPYNVPAFTRIWDRYIDSKDDDEVLNSWDNEQVAFENALHKAYFLAGDNVDVEVVFATYGSPEEKAISFAYESSEEAWQSVQDQVNVRVSETGAWQISVGNNLVGNGSPL